MPTLKLPEVPGNFVCMAVHWLITICIFWNLIQIPHWTYCCAADSAQGVLLCCAYGTRWLIGFLSLDTDLHVGAQSPIALASSQLARLASSLLILGRIKIVRWYLWQLVNSCGYLDVESLACHPCRSHFSCTTPFPSSPKHTISSNQAEPGDHNAGGPSKKDTSSGDGTTYASNGGAGTPTLPVASSG